MSNDRVPMTREGFEKLKSDLERMQSFEMVEVATRIATARDLGDLSENAEYHAAREDHGLAEAKANMMRDRIARAYVIEAGSLPTDTVVFGTRVTVLDLDADEEETFDLVGPGQENADTNRILTGSPIGQGLLGKKKGETVEIPVPRGTIRFKVLKIAMADL